MNIYFACSITGGREFENIYQQITAALLNDGHEIPTSHLASSEALANEKILSPREVYLRDVKWIEDCDALIAEVSVPSHGVGYEIGYALGLGKPVLCLHHEDRIVSKMITGNPHPNLSVSAYHGAGQAVLIAKKFLESES